MADIKFSCPKCGGHIRGDESYTGMESQCPHCSEKIPLIPLEAAPPPLPPPPAMPFPPPLLNATSSPSFPPPPPAQHTGTENADAATQTTRVHKTKQKLMAIVVGCIVLAIALLVMIGLPLVRKAMSIADANKQRYLAQQGQQGDSSSSQWTGEWQEYVHKDDMMKFSMPGQPQLTSQTLSTIAGPATLHMYILGRDSGKEAFMAGVSVYDERITKAKPENLLSGARDRMAVKLHAGVADEKKIEINGNPGIEFQFINSPVHGICRIYVVHNRLFELAAISKEKDAPPADSQRFLDSFHLVK